MKVAYFTNLRAPYRTLQLNGYSKIENMELTAYYTDKPSENRKWNVNEKNFFLEEDLKGFRIAGKFGYINKGLYNIVKKSDFIVLGCYEQPTYILVSILCRLMKKPYILSFDGISTNRINGKENFFKKCIKSIVVNKANYIMGNGTVSKEYFNKQFNYPYERIFNQYLTVDGKKINSLYKLKSQYRKEYRKKLGIEENDKVLIYSGRLINIKNVDIVIRAISELKKTDIVFLITGGGELEKKLMELSMELGVRTIITGFIEEQEELFKHYFVGDALILPSTYEPWGLVVNEAMFAGLPVIVSDICGCSLDLVQHGNNGYLIKCDDINDISNHIGSLLFSDNTQEMGENSRKLIEGWKFENSTKCLEKIIKDKLEM